ncbi:hypothetical protein KP509_16G077300 [Ceratopteris richardii]|uniref:Uncharacterized protein n=1 Tax=Ceratopteris richardii TaxID=49495 RepID=A0A8T2T0X6_CERRI|nr:hypothetical protein KP509_16G077300 [Ceratopteris richardii]
MATPNLSASINFVKNYPITLCGFSLIFMPTVHRILLYFTPLLLSTTILILAMITLGSSKDERSSRKLKHIRLAGEQHEWDLHDGLEEEEEEKEKEEEEEVETEEQQQLEENQQGGEGVDAENSVSGTLEKDEDAGETRKLELLLEMEVGIVEMIANSIEPDPRLRLEEVSLIARDHVSTCVDDKGSTIADGEDGYMVRGDGACMREQDHGPTQSISESRCLQYNVGDCEKLSCSKNNDAESPERMIDGVIPIDKNERRVRWASDAHDIRNEGFTDMDAPRKSEKGLATDDDTRQGSREPTAHHRRRRHNHRVRGDPHVQQRRAHLVNRVVEVCA